MSLWNLLKRRAIQRNGLDRPRVMIYCSFKKKLIKQTNQECYCTMTASMYKLQSTNISTKQAPNDAQSTWLRRVNKQNNIVDWQGDINNRNNSGGIPIKTSFTFKTWIMLQAFYNSLEGEFKISVIMEAINRKDPCFRHDWCV